MCIRDRVLSAYGEVVLAYPTGYMVTAAEKGYLEHTNLLIDQPATRRDVAQLLWNACLLYPSRCV